MSSAPKQNAARKRGPWGEDYLMTNPKSALVHADLVRLFSNPKAWECLEEDEKRELLSRLPAHIHPNPDPDPDDPESKIPPLPESFLRYDNNWRAALRNFQSDLESGRYKPDWQKQAKQAVQERAQGKFDDYKEREFEQFWGQKQKINHGLIAGESSKVKLETLIAHGVVRVGDVWKYCRVFGAKKSGIVVEKEAKITAIDGAKLSFLVPTGQRVFLSAVGEKTEDEKIENGPFEDSKAEGEKMEIDDNQDGKIEDDKNEEKMNGKLKEEFKDDTQMDIDPSPALQLNDHTLSEAPDQPIQDESGTRYNLMGLFDHARQSTPGITTNDNKDDIANALAAKKGTGRKRGRPPKRKAPHDEVAQEWATETAVAAEVPETTETTEAGTPGHPDTSLKITDNDTNSDRIPESTSEKEQENASLATPTEADPPRSSTSPKADPETAPCSATPPAPLEAEIHNIAGPNALMKKILEIDGRIKNPPNGNAWKEIRCYRDNQDMGSLWEVRQAWYVKYQQE
ncbi:conserved hypothetical protein [Talaromyces stipitatus ATCC 10500]|uniref:DEUBAD domain-containing protein n=1 Tax=Talaromyces stipitatus (strain ATCC 10500 / CBS 375.48 / QM 6759 / NRRL 1006) TaxID=441959 RepID=B8M6C2_TALSN|nr:uncharacterized protein TSTA_026080 [Talaromyces stipitatus ATCC 10500]EED19297.1 conserved hypothetical protein [Talaromyces stipitatus ATCC 10500]